MDKSVSTLTTATRRCTLSVMAHVEKAAQDAERVLATVWRKGMPVDPVRIARLLSIDVLDAELARNVSGAILKRPGQDPRILLNVRDSANRKRFTCAHEIGHFVSHSESEDSEEYEYTDLRGPLSSTGQDPAEIYANTFAASLLMPYSEVRRLSSDKRHDVLDLALRFGVSPEAMQYRLENLRLG
ncbi:MAG: ImmA/IrrE family metallo-endopeptidase [Gaiellaceae bacterium]